MGNTSFSGPVISTGGYISSGQSGTGVKLGDSASNDYGWADITAPVTVRGVGATDPDWTQVSTGPFYCYAFTVNDEAWFPFHIPHDIVPGTDIYLHCHWFPSGTNTAVVKWQFDYMYAKGFNQEAYDPDGVAISVSEAGPGAAYRAMVSETAAITIPTLTEPDGILYVRLKRVTNGGTDNTDTIFVTTADVHYQTTGINATPGKAPGFYNT